MRKIELVLKEYVSKLSIDNLKYLFERLNARLEGDVSDVLDFISKNKELDEWLKTSKSGLEFFTMIDYFQEFLNKEYNKRIVEFANA